MRALLLFPAGALTRSTCVECMELLQGSGSHRGSSVCG